MNIQVVGGNRRIALVSSNDDTGRAFLLKTNIALIRVWDARVVPVGEGSNVQAELAAIGRSMQHADVQFTARMGTEQRILTDHHSAMMIEQIRRNDDGRFFATAGFFVDYLRWEWLTRGVGNAQESTDDEEIHEHARRWATQEIPPNGRLADELRAIVGASFEAGMRTGMTREKERGARAGDPLFPEGLARSLQDEGA